MAKYFDEQTFKNKSTLEVGEYELCTFKNCDFSEGDLSNIKFLDCNFEDCKLSAAKVDNTAFQASYFKNCVLNGIQFDNCDKFLLSFWFDHCNLDYANFYQLKLIASKFTNCSLKEVDFTETQLEGASFDDCDLAQAVFHYSNLEKADFTTAINYSIDPELNKIRKAKFALTGIAGLLDKYDIWIK